MTGAATVRSWAEDVRRFADDWPAHGGDELAARIDARLRADTGGDGRFTRGGGRRLGQATVEVDARPGEAEVSGAGSRAIWTILEHGTRAHVVRAERGRVLRTPYGPRRQVTVSGSPARRTWTLGADDGLVAVERDAERAWARVGG